MLRRALLQMAIDGVAGRGRKHDPSLSHAHAEEHMAQLCLHAHCSPLAHGRVRNHWHQWYFFDDLWASAHPRLANALLAYGRRWDSLSAPNARPLQIQW